MSRVIVHLDADAFFASVEQAADPRLRGKPMAVGGEKRGIIASASYEARKFGVYTPMPTMLARRLCPKLIVLPGDFEKYEQFSRWMFSYAYDFTPDVEISSIDEGYFDLSRARKPPATIAETIRGAIRDALKISVSEGLGANKLISQIASKLHKPAAFHQVAAGQEKTFLHPLANHWLPGIGPKTAARLNAAGLALIGHVSATPLELLHLLLGGSAQSVKEFSNGIDERPVVTVGEPAKSYSQQETFAADTTDEPFVEAWLHRMADHLMAKVRADRKSARTLTIKVRYNDMDEEQCGESLPEPTDLETDLYPRLRPMLRRAWSRRVSLRMVSLKLSNIYDSALHAELPLEASSQRHETRQRLAVVIDELRKTRGARAILRGHDFLLESDSRKNLPLKSNPKDKQPAVVIRVSQSEKPRAHLPSPTVNRAPAGQSKYPLPHKEGQAALVVRESPLPPPAENFLTGPEQQRLVAAACLHDKGNGDGPSPLRAADSSATQGVRSRPALAVPLAVYSYYSFLNSTLSIEALIDLAKRYELPAIALTDQGNLHGAVEFVQAAQAADIQPILGAEIRLDGKPLRLYVQNATGYANLCRILSPRQDTAPHPSPPLNSQLSTLNSLPSSTEGLIAVSPEPGFAERFPGRFYLEISSPEALRKFSGATQFPLVAAPPIHYAAPEDRLKYDVVQSIRTLTLLRQEHPDKRLDGEFHFRTPRELRALFGGHPELLSHSLEIAERCADFRFSFGPPQFPAFAAPGGASSAAYLRELALAGARRRYGVSVSRYQSQLEEELAIIGQVGYEDYFLTVWGILQTCRERGIDWITRGSAADSLVCYCLGISDVCPIRFDLYFRRFLNQDRMRLHKLPDIDIDFPHDRKDDVIDLIFEKYTDKITAVVGGFSTYQARGAVADVAKVLGLSEHQVRRFTEHFPYAGARGLETVLRENQECRDLPLDEEPYTTALRLAEFLDGFPRYAKMHPCGVVLSRQPMAELTPTFRSSKGYPTTHFDMDAVEAIGLVKIDILAQGGLAAMRDVKAMLHQQSVEIEVESCTARLEEIRSPKSEIRKRSEIRNPKEPGTSSGAPVRASDFGFRISDLLSDLPPDLPSAALPFDDPAVWELIASGGARAVHHIESPAMVGLCRMCNVRDIDGLIAIVSVIRPGAANEQKKAKFARRYQGFEPPDYPHPSLESALRGTFGLVVYEEHVLQICEAFAGLPAGRADVLRRALGKNKHSVIEQIKGEFFAAARARGHDEAKVAEVWELVNGFAGYAFCKAHSTAYGVEAYQSAWLKRYFPAEFMAAVLSNGKGFYHPLVYVLECHRLGIPLLPPWVNEPGPQFTVVQTLNAKAIRVPVTRVKGLSERTAEAIAREFACGGFASMQDFYRRVAPPSEELEALIRVGAFDGFGKTRIEQFWEGQYLRRAFAGDASGQGWLLPAAEPKAPPVVREPTRLERLQSEAELLDFPASGHPLELHGQIAWETYCPVAKLAEHTGREVVVCGLVIEQRIHHQATGELMKFLTLADWTGMVETELFAATYRTYGLATIRYPVLEVTARVEPFENGRGFSLRVLRAGRPRTRPAPGLSAAQKAGGKTPACQTAG